MFFSGYESMYCDNDLTDAAYRDGVVVQAFDIVFDHRHPGLKKGQWDEVYAKQNRAQAYADGLKLYQERKARNFMEVAA